MPRRRLFKESIPMTVPQIKMTLDEHVATRAREILAKKDRTRKISPQNQVCAVIATLPDSVQVKDIAKLYGISASYLSRLRGRAYKKELATPDVFASLVEKSFTPKPKT